MTTYYVNSNKQANGDNEVHTADCRFLPTIANRVLLGDFPGCSGAVAEAKRRGYNANGCKTCSFSCHTS